MSMHLVREVWEALEREQLPPRFLVDIAKDHLFTLCPVCAEEFRLFEVERGRPLPSPSVATAVLQEQAMRLRAEVRAAKADIADLLATPSDHRLAKINRARKRYRGAAVVHGLLEEFWSVFYESPREAYRLAELAWEVAKASHEARHVHELIALAASHMGNAARAAGELKQADQWFAYVRKLLHGEDVRAITVIAKIDFLEGALRKDQRRLPEAERLLTRALTLYRLAGMRGEIIRILLNLAETLFFQRRFQEATRKVRELLLLVDRDSDSRLYLCAQHNLALYLSEQGKHAEAAQILDANPDLYEEHADCWTTLHRAWLSGRIQAGLGDEVAAEASFLAAREGFLAQSIAYDAALVSLDLATLYMSQQRFAEVKMLAEATVEISKTQDLPSETLAALALLQGGRPA